MRRRFVVTDVTRMGGSNVCVAGQFEDGTPVRPVFGPGADLTEGWLCDRGRVVVRPFALVELDFQRSRPQPPHTEDWTVDRLYRRQIRLLQEAERRSWLADRDDGELERVFGTKVRQEPGWYVISDTGTRSLATFRPDAVLGLESHDRPDRPGVWETRLRFALGDRFYALAVTDLAFRYYADRARAEPGATAAAVDRTLLQMLRDAHRLYLRIGLTRGTWAKYPGHCFLQITGVYPFPDYLNGCCFADLRSPPPSMDDVPF